MDNYPIEYTSQPSPLVFIQGLGKDGIPQGSAKDLKRPSTPVVHNPLLINADKITRKQDTVRASSGLELVSLFQKYTLTDDCIWDDDLLKSQSNAQVVKYRFRFVDNEFLLPHFVTENTSADSLDEEPTTPTNSLNSPLSPFNETSDLFPDGIISANWIQKYKDIVPSVFLSIHELDADLTEDEEITNLDDDLIEEIKYLKNSIIKRGIKFISIIVCSKSTILNPDLADRVTRIKKLTGLQNRNSLLFLPSGTEKELKTFVSSVLTSIKPLSLDFYNTVQKKIKRKKSRQSSVQLSQIPQGLIQPFWDARYLIKLAMIEEFKSQVEPALKFWEQSYTSMLEIFKSLPKDHQRWNEFRLLLDFVVFHVVKNFLYMEDCNTAFFKFDLHIQNVITFLKRHEIKPKTYSVLTWLNYQFSWFLGLLDYVPGEIIPVEIPYEITNKSRLSMPNAGYLYLQAVSLTEKRRVQAEQYEEGETVDTYLSLPIEDERKFSYAQESITLLKKALLFFNKSTNFKRSENYVKFEIAESFYKLGKFNDALEQYEECFFALKNETHDWTFLEVTVLERIYYCCLKLENYKKAVEFLIQLGTLPDTKIDIESFNAFGIDKISCQVPIFNIEFFFKKTNIPISENCEAQLLLKSNVNSLISKDLKIDKLILEFEEKGCIPSIIIRQDNDRNTAEYQNIEVTPEDDHLTAKAGISVSQQTQVLQFSKLAATKIGKSIIMPVVKIYLRYKEVELEFDITIDPLNLSSRYLWYENDQLKNYFKILDPLTISILPRRPETSFNIENGKSYYLGESLRIPIELVNNDHEKVTVSIEAVVDVEHHWEEQETNIVLEPSSTITKNFNLQIPSKLAQKYLKFPFKISFFAGDNSEIPIQDTINVNLNILLPLKMKVQVIPRFREEDMPTPFVGLIENIPIPTRYWCVRSNIVLNNEVDIVSSSLSLKHSDEFVTEIFPDKSLKMETSDSMIIYDEFFSSKSGDGAIHREIPLVVTNTMNWKRKNCDVLNKYEFLPTEISLPLFDPRVLLELIELESKIHLKYIIENPAPRIFQFSTSLIEQEGYEISGDLKNNAFPVLPFTRQELNYYMELTSGSRLPTMKVFDLQYKVNLPILPINDLVKTEDDKLVYQDLKKPI